MNAKMQSRKEKNFASLRLWVHNVCSMKFPLSFLLALFIASCSETADQPKFSKLVWSDEFDKDGLPDPSKWNYSVGNGCPNLCGWGNNELQYYTEKEPKNARVENGNLIIEVHKEEIDSFDYTSAKLVTQGIEDWKYGRFEIRAKLPIGKGIWSAIWMLPTNRRAYGQWPNCGEIDIMENVGYNQDTIHATAHTGAYNHMIHTQKSATHFLPESDEKFHTYILEWEEDEWRAYIDDTHFYTFENEQKSSMEWPFDQPFYLILNVAYGGNWGGAMGLEPELLPQKMEVDYVRVYQ